MAPKRKRTVWQRPTSTESSFTDCPACQMKVVSYLMNHHLDWDCLALLNSKELPHSALAAETTEAFSKISEGLSCNREPELHAHDIGIKPQDGSSQPSIELKLDAHSSDELGLGGPLASNKGFQCSTHHVCLAGGKQFCIGSSLSGINSEAEHNDYHLDHSLEKKEQIFSCSENVIPGKLDSNRVQKEERSQSSAEASTSGPKNSTLGPKSTKCDGWRFITSSLPSKGPKGHYVVEDFISEKEEQDILCFLDTDLKNPWKTSTFNGLHIGKAYGLSTDVRKRCVRPAVFEMPKILGPVLERMRTTVPILKDFWPNETNAIDYCKHQGHWLRPHVDDRQLSGTILVNLSLCGDCRMTYERERGPRESYKVLLRRRCIQIQTGECRYNFTHSILNKDLLAIRRVSMTFRQSLSS